MAIRVETKERLIDSTLTRPTNTTQYAAGDQVSNSTSAPTALEFAGAALYIGGRGRCVGGICVDSANQATKPNFELYLFDGSAAPTAQNDNAAWAPTDANMNNFIGKLVFSEWVVGTSTSGADGNCFSEAAIVSLPFKCASTVRSIWGLVVERGTYTPVSGEIFKFRLRFE